MIKMGSVGLYEALGSAFGLSAIQEDAECTASKHYSIREAGRPVNSECHWHSSALGWALAKMAQIHTTFRRCRF